MRDVDPYNFQEFVTVDGLAVGPNGSVDFISVSTPTPQLVAASGVQQYQDHGPPTAE